MKICNKLVVLVAFLTSNNLAYAQFNIDSSLIASFDSTQFYFKFKENNISVPDLLTNHSGNFRLSNNSTLVFLSESSNMTGGKVQRFQQVYSGVPIEDTRLNIESNSLENPTYANGRIFSSVNVNVNPSIISSVAIGNALNEMNATKYYWQDSTLESDLKEQRNDTNATYYPNAELVLLPKTDQETMTQSFYLCFKIIIYSIEPIETACLYINANDGTLVEKRQISNSCKQDGNPNKSDIALGCTASSCQQGSGPLHVYGSQNIYTDKFGYGVLNSCKYRLKDNCTGTTLYTRKYVLLQIVDIRDDSNLWSSGGTDQDGATAHWSIEKTHDYFRTRYGRNSWDGNYSQLSIYTDKECTGCNTNAWFTGNSIVITKTYGSDTHPFIFLDWLGHEFTHGITLTTAYLTYQGESGALNEGFSDIFGSMIEEYALSNFSSNTSSNYIIGEHTNGSGYRNMSNPNQFSHPDTYNGIHWSSTSSSYDNGGVHINSGVLNYWFYLVAEGGSGTNDKGNQYCVHGIGKSKASDIAWKTLTTKLYSSANFSNCMYLSIQSAIELYGANSNEVAQVTAAWFAVGVGSNYTGSIDVKNHVASGVENFQYNSKIEVQNFTAQNGSDVTITSNTEIALLPSDNFNQGAIANLFIAPACAGGARFGNPASGKNTDQTFNSSISSASDKLSNPNETSNYFLISPNPSHGIFKLQLDNNLQYPKQIVIRDVMGRSVKIIDNPSYEEDVNLEKESPGIYMINVYYDNKVISKRIIRN